MGAARKPPHAGKGRKRGVPNRATRDELAQLLERNLPRLPEWLRRVARTDPAKARELAQRFAGLGITLPLPH